MEYLDLTALDTPLFAGIPPEERPALLECLQARSAGYGRGEIIWPEGEEVRTLGLIACGQVQLLRDDFWGNRSILGQLGPGELFGEAYAWGGEPLGVTAQAAAPCRIWFLDARRLTRPCAAPCPAHAQLTVNLVEVLCAKNRLLSRKIAHLSQRSIRSKVLSYLSWEAGRQGSSRFSIPFDRQGLADYLSVDRSALSQELGNMRREGLLDFHKNHFLLRAPAQA